MPREPDGKQLDPPVGRGARHGVSQSVERDLAPQSRDGRFGRMFPYLSPCDADVDALDELVRGMQTLAMQGGRQNRRIAAGYTYLGQFIDHDITFDATSRFDRDNDLDALVNLRTPRFDLDSLYGAGPADQPYLYDWDRPPHPGAKLLATMDGEQEVDLPRNDPGRALIGDARNDEHLIVSQLHLLFLRFHNLLVDRLAAAPTQLTGRALFDEAQRLVRWHYQWIVMHDFLPTILPDQIAKAVIPVFLPKLGLTLPTATRGLCRSHDEPIIPVEFSGAAFRFAHSLVRDKYNINNLGPTHGAVPIFPDANAAQADDTKQPPHLGGFRRMPRELAIQWDRFFFDRALLLSAAAVTEKNPAQVIDETLAKPLFGLPLRFTGGDVPASGGPDTPTAAPDTIALARLNLHRGRAIGLPSGRDVALAMGQAPLTPEQLFPSEGSVVINDKARKELVRAPPLWYYVLREAAVKTSGQSLGPVGGRIVARVLVGLLESDPRSYLRQQPSWTPADCVQRLGLGETGAIDSMAALAKFAAPPRS